jgi:hypothetical protein
MPLEVHPLVESDFAEFTRIQIAAFSSGGGITKALKPVPLPSGYVEKSIEKHIKSWREEPDVHYLKVIDTELGGRMIAGAKWRVNEKERSEEYVKKSLPVPGKDEEGRPAAQDLYWYLNRVRWQFMGTKPFYCAFPKPLSLASADVSSSTHACHRPRASSARCRSDVGHLGN